MHICSLRSLLKARSRVLAMLLTLFLVACRGEAPEPLNAFAAPPPRVAQGNIAAATRLSWKIGPDCNSLFSDQTPTRNTVADLVACPRTNGRDFVAMALSGGGVKAATFAGETMFMLQHLGLLEHVDMISAASGGSMAAALYAASCDPPDGGPAGSAPCSVSQGLRPRWEYQSAMRRLTAGFAEMLGNKSSVLGAGFHVATNTTRPDDFARFIDRELLSRCTRFDTIGPCGTAAAPAPSQGLTFAELNPRRPHLILNATIVGAHRDQADLVRRRDAGRYLQRRNSDEFFHFAFTPMHFRQLSSRFDSFPVGYAVAASSAIPALFDYARLKRFSDRADDWTTLFLTDGGNNDNQALMEVYFALQEALARGLRSDIPAEHELRERFWGNDRALVFVVNSSLTETTGRETTPNGREFKDDESNAPEALLARAFTAIDTYSGVNYSLRTRLYQRELLTTLAALEKACVDLNRRSGRARQPACGSPPTRNSIRTPEIGLTMLDAFPLGGREALRRRLSGIDGEPTEVERSQRDPEAFPSVDPDRYDYKERRIRHLRAFTRLQDRTARQHLGLPDIHPQCLFEAAKRTDRNMVTLASFDEQAGNCLRLAARWASALRVQELCDEHQDSAGNGGNALARPADMDAVCLRLTVDNQMPPLACTLTTEEATAARTSWPAARDMETKNQDEIDGFYAADISLLGPTETCGVHSAPTLALPPMSRRPRGN